MNDSSINPILLSSSDHLENVEQLIKNLEKHTLDLDNFEDILSDRKRQEIITQSFSAVSSRAMGIDDTPDDNFLVKSISLHNTGSTLGNLNEESVSMDSLLNHRDIFENDDFKKQQTPPTNDQSLYNDQDAGFTWDDQYDTRANYRLTFSTDKIPQVEMKPEKLHKIKHKHHHRHHAHQNHRTHRADSQSSSNYSDEGLSQSITNNMNDWSMRSSSNALEEYIENRDNKTPIPSTTDQQPTFLRSQSHPPSSSPQQQVPSSNNNNNNNNNSPNSSTTSSSSSASWKRMKESQRTTSTTETKEARPPSPLSLYKIFQQKAQNAASSAPRSAFQFYRQQTDSIVPNNIDSMTISGEKMMMDKSKSSHYQKRQTPTERSSSQTTSSTDQAIQTSILVDSSSNSQMNSRFQPTTTTVPKSESYNYISTNPSANSPHHLVVPSRPSPAPIASSAIHKSLPDLAFISQYSKELPRSRTTSPAPMPNTSSVSVNSNQMVTSPTVIQQQQQQQKQEAERPRTLKSIKRYKNSKHSTEPLNVFYSPQLGKTFAAVPASAVVTGSNESPTIIKMKLPPSYSFPKGQRHRQQQAANLKSCLKYGSRANSCDIEAMLQDRKLLTPVVTIPEPARDEKSTSPTTKRRCSEADALEKEPTNVWPPMNYVSSSSNDINSYVLQDSSGTENRSDYDLSSLQQQNQTKKSVSFSDNIAQHLISPCNPAIKIDPAPEMFDFNDESPPNSELAAALHGNKESVKRKPTLRYGEMRRCQTDVIVVDRIQHLHSFTESPPNEFRLQETDSFTPAQDDEDDQTIMENTHVNIIPNLDESPPAPSVVTETSKPSPTNETMTASNDKENKVPEQPSIMNTSMVSVIQTNDPLLDGLIERISRIVKRIFEIKRSDKTFFLNNEHNIEFDKLLKDDLCTILQDILEHGIKPQRKDLPLARQVTLWKIIETSIDHGQALQSFVEAKQIAQNSSPYWVYKFQAFIFALLNKNELISWLYHFMKLKDVLQRYYQPPDALILTYTSITFNLFDRIMAQLEKLSPLAFRLVYKPPALPANIEEELNAAAPSTQAKKSTAKEWVLTMSKRTTKTLTQPIVQQNTTTTATTAGNPANNQPPDTIRSAISRKFNSLFTKTNTTAQPQRKMSSAVTARLPTSKTTTLRTQSPATTGPTRRPPISNVFANATAASATNNKPVIVSSPKLNNGSRTGTMRRGISPSVVVAPSPPSTINNTATTPTNSTAFQSKIPRPSLNVDKPKSARYRSTAPPPK